MSTITKKPKLSAAAKERLIKILREADARRKYRWAIDNYEKYFRSFEVDINMRYRLGLLYDHLAIFKYRHRKDKRGKTFFRSYLKKAEKIYKDIVKKKPSNALAYLGLARTNYYLGRKTASNYYSKKAYELNIQLPKNKRGALGIGGFFLDAGDLKRAERWFKRELRDLGNNNLGANVNLLIFYDVTKQYKKAVPYALKSEKLISRELKKSDYKGFNQPTNNKTLKIIWERIERVKNKAKIK